MKITVTKRNINLSDTLQERLEEQIESLSRYFDELDNAQVIVQKEKDDFMIEIKISSRHKQFFSKEQSSNINDSINGVIEKLERQIRKYKTKVISKKKVKSTAEISKAVDTKSRKEKDLPDLIVYKDKLTFKSVDEAVLDMDSKDYLFNVFINSDTKKINVLFHQKDGNYGLIVS